MPIKTLNQMKLFCQCFLLLSIAFSYGCNTKNAIDKDRQQINNVCDEIMEYLKNGKITEISNLLKTNSYLIGKNEIDTLQSKMSEQFNAGLFSQYGKLISYELVKETNLNNFATKRVYALRSEHYYFVITFSLYHSSKGWEITGFKYDEASSSAY